MVFFQPNAPEKPGIPENGVQWKVDIYPGREPGAQFTRRLKVENEI